MCSFRRGVVEYDGMSVIVSSRRKDAGPQPRVDRDHQTVPIGDARRGGPRRTQQSPGPQAGALLFHFDHADQAHQ